MQPPYDPQNPQPGQPYQPYPPQGQPYPPQGQPYPPQGMPYPPPQQPEWTGSGPTMTPPAGPTASPGWSPPQGPPVAAPPAPPPAAPAQRSYGAITVALAVGTLIPIALGYYGKTHKPVRTAFLVPGFSNIGWAKTWLTTAVFVLALGQVFGALWMYGKLKFLGDAPGWVGPAHRWSGRLAVLLSVPVAVTCLYWAGFQTLDLRTTIHCVLGCLVYGAFAAKMIVLSRDDAPGWALPVFGTVVFTAFTGLWLTMAYYAFSKFGIHT